MRLDKVSSLCPSVHNLAVYRKYRSVYNKTLRAAKKLYFENELCNAGTNLKRTWNLIRQAINLKPKKNSSAVSNLLINNIESHSTKTIAEHFNKFFATAPSIIVNNLKKS